MIGSTITLENITNIYSAMLKIESIDRSNHFANYLEELEWRMEYLKNAK